MKKVKKRVKRRKKKRGQDEVPGGALVDRY